MPVADTLLTPRLVLRRPRAGDLDAYRAYCAGPRSGFVGGPFSAVQAFDKLAAMAGHWVLRGYGRYVLERNGAAIGHAGPMRLDDAQPPEMTWTLWTAEAEGQGLATEAARAVLAHVLVDCRWPSLIARIDPSNTASVRLAERLGATRSDAPPPDWAPNVQTWTFGAEALA